MFKVLFWARNKPGQTVEEFKRYWLKVHAPLAKDNLEGLRRYEINIVTGTPQGEPLVGGLAELYFDSKEAFVAAISTTRGKEVLDDIPKFAGEAAPMFAEEHRIL